MTARDRALVVGGGTMGMGIAYSLWISGYAVQLVEVAHARHSEILRSISDVFDGAVSRGKVDPGAVAPLEEGIRLIGDISDAETSPDVAIEAVPEEVELKWEVLRAMQERHPVLLGSNTSSISISHLASRLDDPSALIGLHFFNPVWINSLVEIVVAEGTPISTLEGAQRLVERIGKEAVVVKDRPGFATSRLGVLLGLEAIRMVEEGVASPADIDRAMVLGYRHPMGPLRLTDLVGLDVRMAIAANLEKEYGERFATPALLRQMVERGQLGMKTGKGFYDWATNIDIQDFTTRVPSGS